ncbi:hypothetical protein [Oscillatoria sp. FACHB-1407]|nr:hypothetical protein [Oscillatoria sp. FACHB-1407]
MLNANIALVESLGQRKVTAQTLILEEFSDSPLPHRMWLRLYLIIQ